jgi:hypothetical protein
MNRLLGYIDWDADDSSIEDDIAQQELKQMLIKFMMALMSGIPDLQV